MRPGHEAVSLEAGPWCWQDDGTVLVVYSKKWFNPKSMGTTI